MWAFALALALACFVVCASGAMLRRRIFCDRGHIGPPDIGMRDIGAELEANPANLGILGHASWVLP